MLRNNMPFTWFKKRMPVAPKAITTFNEITTLLAKISRALSSHDAADRLLAIPLNTTLRKLISLTTQLRDNITIAIERNTPISIPTDLVLSQTDRKLIRDYNSTLKILNADQDPRNGITPAHIVAETAKHA
jgi:hypothetical protein